MASEVPEVFFKMGEPRNIPISFHGVSSDHFEDYNFDEIIFHSRKQDWSFLKGIKPEFVPDEKFIINPAFYKATTKEEYNTRPCWIHRDYTNRFIDHIKSVGFAQE